MYVASMDPVWLQHWSPSIPTAAEIQASRHQYYPAFLRYAVESDHTHAMIHDTCASSEVDGWTSGLMNGWWIVG